MIQPVFWRHPNSYSNPLTSISSVVWQIRRLMKWLRYQIKQGNLSSLSWQCPTYVTVMCEPSGMANDWMIKNANLPKASKPIMHRLPILPLRNKRSSKPNISVPFRLWQRGIYLPLAGKRWKAMGCVICMSAHSVVSVPRFFTPILTMWRLGIYIFRKWLADNHTSVTLAHPLPWVLVKVASKNKCICCDLMPTLTYCLSHYRL